MTTYSNAEAGSEALSIQYNIDRLTADVRTGGNQAWRHNNPALLPFNISAREHGALGSAYGLAIFPNKAAGEAALETECGRPKYAGYTFGKMIAHFVPEYVINPPEFNKVTGKAILPWIESMTELDVHKPLSDPNALLRIIESQIGWEEGTTEPLVRDTEAQAPNVSTVSGNNVLINSRTAVHADSGGVLQTIDVCMTPTPVGVIPIPYCNVARSSDAASTASSVKINGNPTCNLGSNFSQSTGDEAGTRKGIISGVTQGKAEFILGSFDVLIEGKPAVRQGDLMISNNKNTPPMPLNQPSGPMPRGLQVQSPAAIAQAEMYTAQTALTLHAGRNDDLVGAGQFEVIQGGYQQQHMLKKGS